VPRDPTSVPTHKTHVPIHDTDVPTHKTDVYDSNEILTLDRLSYSLVELGAGVIGCEDACIFAARGVWVVRVGATTQPSRGQTAHRGSDAPPWDGDSEGPSLGPDPPLGERAGTGGSSAVSPMGRCSRATSCLWPWVEWEKLLVAASRVGNAATLGLERVGPRAGGRTRIEVNAHDRTAVRHVDAARDVRGFPARPANPRGETVACAERPPAAGSSSALDVHQPRADPSQDPTHGPPARPLGTGAGERGVQVDDEARRARLPRAELPQVGRPQPVRLGGTHHGRPLTGIEHGEPSFALGVCALAGGRNREQTLVARDTEQERRGTREAGKFARRKRLDLALRSAVVAEPSLEPDDTCCHTPPVSARRRCFHL
jgi:hypothetical protein